MSSTRSTTSKTTALTNYRYRLASFESRNRLQGRHCGDSPAALTSIVFSGKHETTRRSVAAVLLGR